MPVKTHTDVYELPLYSKVRRAIEQAPMEHAPIDAWQDWLLAQAKNGVSQNELDYLCIPRSTDRASKNEVRGFHDFNEAVDYRESLERTITTSVPVLWLNAAQRVSLMRLGLPVLGAVDKLPASASPHAHA